MNHSEIEALARDLAGLQLPVLRVTRDEVGGLANDARLNMKEFARALFKDMGLALKVLIIANSIEERRFSTELESLEKAAMMVGVNRIAKLASESPTIEESFDEDVQQQLKRLYARSYLTALIAESWAGLRHDISPGEVGLAGLCYNLGGVLLWIHRPGPMTQLTELKHSAGVYPHEAEYVGLGFNIEPVGYRVAKALGLPRLSIEAMKAHYAQEMRSLGVMLAAQMAYTAAHDWAVGDLRKQLSFAAEYVGVSIEKILEIFDDIIERFNGEVDTYQVQPLSRLDPERIQEIVASQTAVVPPFCLAPTRDTLKAALQGLAQGGMSEEAVVNLTLEAMRDGLALNRAVFARLMPDGKVLHATSFIGTDYEPVFNHFRLSLEGNHLFTVLMKKPTAFWMNEGNRAKAWQHMPVEVVRLIGVDSFFALSVFVNGQPYGLFYADRRGPACALDASAFEGFKRLCALATNALSKVRKPIEGPSERV